MADNGFSLNHLTETEFEEFCFDLLHAMGATRLSWRKGTGLDSSPADQGRDIECYFQRKDIDGQTSEKWFVESKHHTHGVPAGKLQTLLAWASAERPDVVLIIASNFLSNPAKNYLESYNRNNKPAFKIKVWEKPDLERLSSGKPLVLRKYGLAGPFDFLNILHPAHVRYLRNPPVNTMDYFFDLLDKLEPGERRSFFTGAFLNVINPKFREPNDPRRQTLGELAIGKVDYTEFRTKCHQLVRHIAPHFLIQAIVFYELSDAFNCADKTSIQQTRENMKQTLAFLQEELQKPKADIETINGCIVTMTDSIEHIEERTENNYKRYCSFCEKIVTPLLEEQHPLAVEWLERAMKQEESKS